MKRIKDKNIPLFLIAIAVFFLMTMSFPFSANAVEDNSSEIKVVVNGSQVLFDTKPFLDSNDRTMVPIRFVAQKLGAVVGWSEEEQKVSIVLDNKKIFLWIGSNTVQVDEKQLQIDTQPIVKNDRTMVPLRFISETFGAAVDWDSNTNTVAINLETKNVGGITDSAKKQIATLTGNIVNIRENPGTNYAKIGQLPKGTELEVLGDGIDSDGETWYKVKLPQGNEGWIAGWLADISVVEDNNEDTSLDDESSADVRQRALIIGGIVNVRSGPSLDYGVVSQVNKGDIFQVVGNTSEWYEVKLDDDSQGWIHGSLVSIQSVDSSRGTVSREDYVDNLPQLPEELDYAAVQNIILEGSGSEVHIIVQGNTPLEHSAFMLQNPTRLVIDIPNTAVALTEDKLVQDLNSKLVSSVRIGQFTEDTSRIVIDLKEPVSYNIEKLSNDKVLSILIHESSLQGKVIVIDPGHASIQPGGWSDPGAIGPGGTYEADVVLEIAEKTADILTEQGATVIMTRTGDTALSLAGRAAVANDIGADIFVSIHANANNNSAIKGSSVYYYGGRQRQEREKLARLIQYYLVKNAGTEDGGIIEKGFKVLTETTVPSVLVETAYISNPQEEKLLKSDDFQKKIAQGIAEGINSYFMN